MRLARLSRKLGLQNKFAQVCVFGEVGDLIADVVSIYGDVLVLPVCSGEGDLV